LFPVKNELIYPVIPESAFLKESTFSKSLYLLFDSNGKKLTNVKLTQRLNKIFGKKASVNQLRHTYLSDKYQDTIKLNKEMADDMKAMGSSRAQESIYIKKD
jgi:hypothetical protein